MKDCFDLFNNLIKLYSTVLYLSLNTISEKYILKQKAL